jgi:hypothetical protein
VDDVNRVLHRLTHAGATVSAKKLFLCLPEVKIVGQLSTYEGRVPHKSTVSKIQTWPPCETVSEVRGFLGVAGVVRKWIEGFAQKAAPLVNLTKKEVQFEWREEPEQKAMDVLKEAVINCPAIRPIDYTNNHEVILAVDSSVIATGFIATRRERPPLTC